jgi:hypothetical protein
MEIHECPHCFFVTRTDSRRRDAKTNARTQKDLDSSLCSLRFFVLFVLRLVSHRVN